MTSYHVVCIDVGSVHSSAAKCDTIESSHC